MIARLLRLAVVAVGLPLAGCFQPLYGPGLGSTSAAIGTFAIEAIGEHLGHQLKSELESQLNNGKPPEKALYRLAVEPRGSSAGIVADSAASRPQVMSYIVNARYTLNDVTTGKVMTTGNAQVQVSYDRDLQRFATVRALRDAEIRASRQLAEQIKARIMPVIAGLKD